MIAKDRTRISEPDLVCSPRGLYVCGRWEPADDGRTTFESINSSTGRKLDGGKNRIVVFPDADPEQATARLARVPGGC